MTFKSSLATFLAMSQRFTPFGVGVMAVVTQQCIPAHAGGKTCLGCRFALLSGRFTDRDIGGHLKALTL